VREFYMHEICPTNAFEQHGRTQIFFRILHFDVMHGQTFNVSNEKSMCRHRAEAVRVRVDLLVPECLDLAMCLHLDEVQGCR